MTMTTMAKGRIGHSFCLFVHYLQNIIWYILLYINYFNVKSINYIYIPVYIVCTCIKLTPYNYTKNDIKFIIILYIDTTRPVPQQ